MVLTGRAGRPPAAGRGGAGTGPATSPRRRGHAAASPRRHGRLAASGRERGSQALEFAMVLPMVALALVLVLCTGLVGMEMVHAHGIAREAARAAAAGDDARAGELARAAAGGRELSVRLDPPQGSRAAGDLVTAQVGMASHVLARFGLDVALHASATMQAEGP